MFAALFAISIAMLDGSFAVEGWAPPATPPASGWSSLFRVYAGTGDVPPMLGEYSVEGGRLRFRPRFPLSPGVSVRAEFTGAGRVESRFEIPRADVKPTTRVLTVYPTANVLPENQLKLYIEFSAPMSQGEAWRHLRLLRADGSAVELPFLEIEQEMWDPEGRRLTVLFDPGRIKRGLLPLRDTGPAMEGGGSYTLAVDAAWADAKGAPLVAPYTKKFGVGEADRDPIQPSSWRIGSIEPGTRMPLVIEFGEPLDAALAQRLIWVDSVAGRVELSDGDQRWTFTPAEPWPARPHSIKVDTALEDLAGNRVGRSFDIDTQREAPARTRREVLTIPVR